MRLAQGDEGEALRARLREGIAQLRAGAAALGLRLLPSDTPIQPLLLGDACTALAWSRALEQAGFHVPAIRPPTVPQGQARLRIALSAAHAPEQIGRLLEALAVLHAKAGAATGAVPAAP